MGDCAGRIAKTGCSLELDAIVSEDDEVIELDDDTFELDETADDEIAELDDVILELEETDTELDELGVFELEKFADELDIAEELDFVEELDFTDGDDLTVISTLKVTYSLSEDSVMSESAIFMLSPVQKTKLLKSVTFPVPGNTSSAVAVVPFAGTASTTSTYIWAALALTALIFQIEST